MRWEDERYIRFYTRDTPEFLAMSWTARALFGLIMRKVDRAGILVVGRLGLKGVAVAVGGPWSEVEAPLGELLEDGCVVFRGASEAPTPFLFLPGFMEAQEAVASDALRKRIQRERAHAAATIALGLTNRDDVSTQRDIESRDVTESHAASRGVTPSHAESLRAVPSVPSVPPVLTKNAGARGQDPETAAASTAPPSWESPIHDPVTLESIPALVASPPGWRADVVAMLGVNDPKRQPKADDVAPQWFKFLANRATKHQVATREGWLSWLTNVQAFAPKPSKFPPKPEPKVTRYEELPVRRIAPRTSNAAPTRLTVDLSHLAPTSAPAPTVDASTGQPDAAPAPESLATKPASEVVL